MATRTKRVSPNARKARKVAARSRKTALKARKVARKPAARVARTAAARRPAKASRGMTAGLRGGDHDHADDGVCACDLDFLESEATPDNMLPEARGGVEGAA